MTSLVPAPPTVPAPSPDVAPSPVVAPSPAPLPKKKKPKGGKSARHKRKRFAEQLEAGRKTYKFPIQIYSRPPIAHSRAVWQGLLAANPALADEYGGEKVAFSAWRQKNQKFRAELLFMKHPHSPTRFFPDGMSEAQKLRLCGPDPANPHVFPSLSEAACAVKERKTAKPDSEWRTVDLEGRDVMFYEIQNDIDPTSVGTLEEHRALNTSKFAPGRLKAWAGTLQQLELLRTGQAVGEAPRAAGPKRQKVAREHKPVAELLALGQGPPTAGSLSLLAQIRQSELVCRLSIFHLLFG